MGTPWEGGKGTLFDGKCTPWEKKGTLDVAKCNLLGIRNLHFRVSVLYERVMVLYGRIKVLYGRVRVLYLRVRVLY